VGNSARHCNASWSARVKLETVRCEQDAGNTELHGAEHCGTIQRGTRVVLETVRCDWNAGNADSHGTERRGTIQGAVTDPACQSYWKPYTGVKHCIYYIREIVRHSKYSTAYTMFWTALKKIISWP
jgi:hypothetical protein